MISVIVPVYRVEQYLDACIESILGQTFQDFELILVDDGSPDNCGEICDRYAGQDARIRVVHQENRGLSGARNTGTGLAEGKYITYIDSDDRIGPEYLEVLYNNAVEYRAQVSVCGYCLVWEHERAEQKWAEQKEGGTGLSYPGLYRQAGCREDRERKHACDDYCLGKTLSQRPEAAAGISGRKDPRR